MSDRERRREEAERTSVLKRGLTEAQRDTLESLERFGWSLKFLRKAPFQPGVAVLKNPDTGRFATISEDGTLDEDPPAHFRQ